MPSVAAPRVSDVLLAMACVLVGSLATAAALSAAWRSRNWLGHVFATGSALFTAGIVGQRSFPSADTTRRLGLEAAKTSAPGPFDAGVTIPAVNLQITPVSLAGLLVAAVSLSLLLIFESGRRPRTAARPLEPLNDLDTG